MLLSPASLTLKFDAIFDVPEGDEALSDSALPLLFRPLSPRALDAPPGLPISYSYDPAPIVEEIIVASPASGTSTLVASPATPGHDSSVRGIAESPRSVRLVRFACCCNHTRRATILTFGRSTSRLPVPPEATGVQVDTVTRGAAAASTSTLSPHDPYDPTEVWRLCADVRNMNAPRALVSK
jgi:hypothetical protein